MAAIALAAAVYAVIAAGVGRPSTLLWMAAAIAGMSVVGFAWWEHRAPDPPLPPPCCATGVHRGQPGCQGHDPRVEWCRFDVVVAMYAWGYVTSRDGFLAWAERVETVTGLANSAATLDATATKPTWATSALRASR